MIGGAFAPRFNPCLLPCPAEETGRCLRQPDRQLRAGVRVLPDTPYLLTGSPDDPSLRVQYYHDRPQLHLLLGASYDY